MADMFEGAAEFLADTIVANLSQTVTYASGDDEVELSAMYMKKEYPVVGEDGILLNIISHDFVIRAADLTLDSVAHLPARNDTITLADDSIYRVLPVAGDQVYRPCDPYGYSFRIHTKKVEA